MLNKITILIGLLSSLITVGLTVYNAQLNQTIQRAELRLKETETDLKKRAQDLDVSGGSGSSDRNLSGISGKIC